MCVVYSGTQIKSRQDVQNLVIGIIFRQRNKYKPENIINMVQYYMKGSSYLIDKKSLQDIVFANLELLDRNDKIQCENGYYIPRPINML